MYSLHFAPLSASLPSLRSGFPPRWCFCPMYSPPSFASLRLSLPLLFLSHVLPPFLRFAQAFPPAAVFVTCTPPFPSLRSGFPSRCCFCHMYSPPSFASLRLSPSLLKQRGGRVWLLIRSEER